MRSANLASHSRRLTGLRTSRAMGIKTYLLVGQIRTPPEFLMTTDRRLQSFFFFCPSKFDKRIQGLVILHSCPIPGSPGSRLRDVLANVPRMGMRGKYVAPTSL